MKGFALHLNVSPRLPGTGATARVMAPKAEYPLPIARVKEQRQATSLVNEAVRDAPPLSYLRSRDRGSVRGMTFASGRKPRYRLALHVFVCALEDHVVLMDIEGDKYLSVRGGRNSQELSELIEGWPSPAPDRWSIQERGGNVAKEGSAESSVEHLLKRGLLTEDFSRGKSAAPVEARAATETFPIFGLDRSPRPYLRYLPQFMIACGRAQRLRKQRPIARVIERMHKRQRHWNHDVLDQEKLRVLVRAHHHLRPLIYTTRDECLYDSLVLLEFLGIYEIGATWVFGFHAAPWIPHCWVRAGRYLLNDSPGNVACCSVLAEF